MTGLGAAAGVAGAAASVGEAGHCTISEVGPAPLSLGPEPGVPNAVSPSVCHHLTLRLAEASPEWSAQHLAEDRDAVATRMLPLLCEVIGAVPDMVLHAAAHRWRFDRVTSPPGLPSFRSRDATLRLGGDRCLGPRVEAAWQSGDAIAVIARDILGGRHAG